MLIEAARAFFQVTIVQKRQRSKHLFLYMMRHVGFEVFFYESEKQITQLIDNNSSIN